MNDQLIISRTRFGLVKLRIKISVFIITTALILIVVFNQIIELRNAISIFPSSLAILFCFTILFYRTIFPKSKVLSKRGKKVFIDNRYSFEMSMLRSINIFKPVTSDNPEPNVRIGLSTANEEFLLISDVPRDEVLQIISELMVFFRVPDLEVNTRFC